ncbi:hypothetical protein Golax_004310 [Gossypium laxum]|uniref:RNase H type-1 domain-containing protein n=1 Tax=Gossypium laxum TaxID=34288 RepID=A0A7J9AJW7_9ROSI|nr:hypothetical protein [Gossypium laxum]
MMFTEKVLDQQELFESILIRLGRWFRAKGGSTGVSLDDFLRAPQNFRVPNTHKNDTKRVIWTPPPCGAVKFNEDAGVVGSNGTVGIGGILSSLVIFSKSSGLTDPALVEVLAIKEALTIYSACKWSGTHKLIEESDCAVAVCWVRSPWNAQSCVRSIIQLGSGILQGSNLSKLLQPTAAYGGGLSVFACRKRHACSSLGVDGGTWNSWQPENRNESRMNLEKDRYFMVSFSVW